MDQKSSENLKAYGFKQGETGESLFFTCPIQLEDRRNVIKSVLPDHFKPSYDYRTLFINIFASGKVKQRRESRYCRDYRRSLLTY